MNGQERGTECVPTNNFGMCELVHVRHTCYACVVRGAAPREHSKTGRKL